MEIQDRLNIFLFIMLVSRE